MLLKSRSESEESVYIQKFNFESEKRNKQKSVDRLIDKNENYNHFIEFVQMYYIGLICVDAYEIN